MPMIETPWRTSRDGLTVLTERSSAVICDLRNSLLPMDERRQYATAIAAVPRMLAALKVAEHVIGDIPATLPGGRLRREAYSLILAALDAAGHPPAVDDE
jgi:hypothetical protein